MSSVDFNFNSSTNCSLVNKILEQGQRLRNCMVQTILSNDPFNKEVLKNEGLKRRERSDDFNDEGSKISLARNKQSGRNYMDEELTEAKILQELGICSSASLVKSNKYNIKYCSCDICKEYNKINNPFEPVHQHEVETENHSNYSLKELSTSKFTQNTQIEKDIFDNQIKSSNSTSTLKLIKTTFEENQSFLKYVDSLKVNINFLKLNSAGNRKVSTGITNESVKFFIEYSLPDIIQRFYPKSKAKVNSGLQPKNHIRYCSKLSRNNEIYFKQSTTHLLSNVDKLDLSSINIDVLISVRSMKDKNMELFGKAQFNLGSIITNQYLSVNQELAILGSKIPVVLGYLNVELQFGCDKLHFGKEFIEAINCSQRGNNLNINLPSGESVFKVLENEQNVFNSKKNTPRVPINTERSNVKSVYEPQKSTESPIVENKSQLKLLYLFLHISQGQILGHPIDSYLVCYGLHKDDIINSQIVYNNSNPAYNFYQTIPILYDEHFLNQLEDKYIIIETWKKGIGEDELIGITRLSLHRFYVIYRNAEVVRNLLKNQNPIIGVDWWEPIINIVTRKNCGQLKSTVALGTEIQINTLKHNLEFKQIVTKNNDITTHYNFIETKNTPRDKQLNSKPVNNIGENVVYDKYVQIPETEIYASNSDLKSNSAKSNTVDVATQSEVSMIETNKNKPCSKEIINDFIEQVLANKDMAQKNVYVENSTNTDNDKMNIEENTLQINELPLKNTTDLLESLQKALALGSNNSKINTDDESIDYFKAHIIIDSALHLPSRRKCKSRRNRTKGGKNSEEILPSTYVTFKTDKDKDFIVTNVIPKSTSPRWDFRCDVTLPVELLLNSQKRLIFKVWRRSSATSLTPNYQTDIVLGFAALDLTVLLSGLPNVQGWFNIVDFSSKCNGQIKIHANPLENLFKFNKYKRSYTPEKPKTNLSMIPQETIQIEADESPPELFSRALKRKFTELEEITQRLKQRLSTVTNDDSDISDDFADEFERDLNTECIETEKINFDSVLKSLELPSVSNSKNLSHTITPSDILDKINDNKIGDHRTTEEVNQDLDRHLMEGKLRIDSLLQKLSLITDNDKTSKNIDNLLDKVSSLPETNKSDMTFSNRYVSGCSLDRETTIDDTPRSLNNNPLLKHLNLDSAESIDPDLIFNPLLFQQIFSGSNEPTPRSDDFKVHSTTLKGLIDSSSTSSTSIDSSMETNRQAPDGAGISADTKSK